MLETDVTREADADLGPDRVEIEACGDELFRAVGLERLQLGVGRGPADVFELERIGGHEAPAGDLGVGERVPDCDGDLVAELHGALAVADEQDVGHGR